MECKSEKRLLANFTKDIRDEKKYNLHHYLQRKEDQWTKPQKCLLIDSIFRDFLIDPIRAAVLDDIRCIFDGIQRSTSFAEYIEDGFALSNNNLPVLIDNVLYDTAGKKFSELDPILQDKILNFEITLYIFTNATDEEIREMYRRQNNGKALTATQKRTAIEPKVVSDIVFPLAEHPFFKKILSPKQLLGDNNRDLIRETLMLLSITDDKETLSFSKPTLDKFVVWYAGNIDESDATAIVDVLDLLDEKMDKTPYLYASIPMILYIGVQCLRDGKNFDKLVAAIKEFSDTYKDNTAYKEIYSKGGTRSSQSVKGRFNYWKNIYAEII